MYKLILEEGSETLRKDEEIEIISGEVDLREKETDVWQDEIMFFTFGAPQEETRNTHPETNYHRNWINIVSSLRRDLNVLLTARNDMNTNRSKKDNAKTLIIDTKINGIKCILKNFENVALSVGNENYSRML